VTSKQHNGNGTAKTVIQHKVSFEIIWGLMFSEKLNVSNLYDFVMFVFLLGAPTSIEIAYTYGPHCDGRNGC
jgi:hypothetical protein